MERLTVKRTDGRWALANNDGASNLGQLEKIPRAIDRLATIENILGDDYDLDHLRELVQAEKDGRLAVLPPENYTFTVRGDIMRGIITANCRKAKQEAEAAPEKEA